MAEQAPNPPAPADGTDGKRARKRKSGWDTDTDGTACTGCGASETRRTRCCVCAARFAFCPLRVLGGPPADAWGVSSAWLSRGAIDCVSFHCSVHVGTVPSAAPAASSTAAALAAANLAALPTAGAPNPLLHALMPPQLAAGVTPQILQQMQSAVLLRQLQLQQMQLGRAAPPTATNMAARIYVGSLPYEVVEEQLRAPFSVFGPVVKIDMPKENGRSKGFCFVEFTVPEHALAAQAAMNGVTLFGRQIKVNKPTQALAQQAAGMPSMAGLNPQLLMAQAAQASQLAGGPPVGAAANLSTNRQACRIYVGSVYFELTADQLKEVFEPFGVVVSCQLIPDPANGRHKGYGFVEFAEENRPMTPLQP